MKRKSKIKLLSNGALCALLVAVVGSPAFAQTVIDFEKEPYVSGYLNGQDYWTVAKTNEVVLTAAEIAKDLEAAGLLAGETVHGGNQAALFSRAGSGGASVRPIDGLGAARIVSLTAWARPLTPRTDGAVNTNNIFLTMEDWNNTRAAAFRFGYWDSGSGTLAPHIDYASAGAATWQDSGVSWTSNTWYEITMTANYYTKTYDMFVSGTKVNASPLAFYGGNNSENLSQIRVYRGSNQAGMILDDVTITDVTPVGPFVGPATGTLSGWSFNIYDTADGTTPDISTIAVKVDGVPVVPTSITQTGNIGWDGTGVTTVAYESATPIFASGSTHTNTVDFEGKGLPPVHATLVYTAPMANDVLDTVHGYVGRLQGKAAYAASGSGHTGKPGDYAVDIGAPARQSNNVLITDTGFLDQLNAAAMQDALTFSLWVKHRVTSWSSIFWAFSSSAAPDNRGMQMHCPYYSNLDAKVFFDTGGTEPENRVSTLMTTFPLYDGKDTWWNTWHHIVAIKNGAAKQVWIDGQLLLSATDQAQMVYDLTKLYLGCGIQGGKPAISINGWIDDFAAYSTALTEADVVKLFNGDAPDQIGAASSLLAWWSFDDAPDLTWIRVNNRPAIEFNHVLQSSENVTGPYLDRFDATSPYTPLVAPGSQMFFRTRK